MKTKITIKTILGKVIFEFSKENNTVKDTVLEAIKEGKDLRSANLRSADLSYADLSSADLRSANLSYADLSYAKNSEYAIALTRICPEGDIIGWKEAYEVGTMKKVIIKLLIPKEAKRNNAFGRKCRAEFADVLEMDGATEAVSDHNREFKYKVGERVTPDKFDEDFMNECSNGIHFFITRLEAENY